MRAAVATRRRVVCMPEFSARTAPRRIRPRSHAGAGRSHSCNARHVRSGAPSLPRGNMAKAKKKSRSKAKRRTAPNAIELLKRDHADVKKSFKDFEKAKYKDPNACEEFIASICKAIEMHAAVEEEI